MRRFGHFSEVKGETNIEENQMKKRLNSSSQLNRYMDEILNLPKEIGEDSNGNLVDAKILDEVSRLPREI